MLIRLLTSVYWCHFEFTALDYENYELIISHVILHTNIVSINETLNEIDIHIYKYYFDNLKGCHNFSEAS